MCCQKVHKAGKLEAKDNTLEDMTFSQEWCCTVSQTAFLPLIPPMQKHFSLAFSRLFQPQGEDEIPATTKEVLCCSGLALHRHQLIVEELKSENEISKASFQYVILITNVM